MERWWLGRSSGQLSASRQILYLCRRRVGRGNVFSRLSSVQPG